MTIVLCLVAQSCSALCNPMDYTVHGILHARILEGVAVPFSRESSQTRDQTQVSLLQADSLPAVPQRKPKNTGVGSLSLIQRIFLTQELNRGLPHCRRILHQLSYQGRLVLTPPDNHACRFLTLSYNLFAFF